MYTSPFVYYPVTSSELLASIYCKVRHRKILYVFVNSFIRKVEGNTDEGSAADYLNAIGSDRCA